jgi:hypothetical protein
MTYRERLLDELGPVAFAIAYRPAQGVEWSHRRAVAVVEQFILIDHLRAQVF